ncbi:MAG: hypothetical protein IKG69_05745 [Atopobiaceae bacterium]|nr:hypothetical protein [Atopobiaceae bacterium]
MLQSLLLPAAIYTLMLFVPGYLCLRCAHLPRAWAVCCAPIVSTALVGIIGEAYASLGVSATPLSVYVPAACLPLALLVLLQLAERRAATEPANQAPGSFPGGDIAWWAPLLFAAVGIVICNNLFVSELPSIDAIMQNYDVQHHLNGIRAFADAHRASSRGVTFYLAEADAAIRPFGSPSFYPAVWYGQCALLMQATGLSAPAAINVTLAVTLALAYPLGMCAFASAVFGERRTAIAFCGLTCVGFAMFPWCLLLFGPLYPNLVGFALIPASMALCMSAFRAGPSLGSRVVAWAVATVALLGQALLHPNTLFSMFVILVPFVAQLVHSLALERGLGERKAAFAVCAFLVVCLAFWALCYKLPVFHVVIREYWPDYAYPWQEVVNILTQTYTLFFFYEIAAQVLLGVLVVIGFVRTAYDRDVRWLAVSYVIACGICFVCASFTNATIKRFVAGFWYTDAMRVTATAIVVASLLSAHGFAWLFELVCQALRTYNDQRERATHPRLAAIVLGICFVIFNFMPSFNWPGAHAESTDHIAEYRMDGHEHDADSMRTTFGDYRLLFRELYGRSTPMDVHERVFLEEVRAIVGDDLVINNPYDGSTLAYGVYGIRTYYRNANGFGTPAETSQSVAIREGLCDLADDAGVRQAVDDVGARYVLVLDSTYSGNSFLNLRGNLEADAYNGITHVTEDTPGFTEVLQSGSCHLYRID